MTIVVHHLNNSRSQRILWMLEELEMPYEIKHHTRRMLQAPAEMTAVHPLGKSPIITAGPVIIAESGAIVEYLLGQGGGRLASPADGENARRYSYFMHYAEGSMMPELVMLLIVGKLPPLGWFAKLGLRKRVRRHLAWVNQELAGRQWFAGDMLSAADIMMSFPLEFANAIVGLKAYPQLTEWLNRIHARPAYQRGLERGGPTIYR